MKKALIYCRVSSQRQVNEGHGLGSQEKRCKDYAASKGYLVERVFPDEGISGGLFGRPAIKELLGYIDNHPSENFVVIFDDLARFARDVKVHIQLKAEFIGRGVAIECLNFNFEDSPAGELVEMIMASFAQYHRQDNKRQVIQKMKARLEAGYWPFMPPLGLINKKDELHGKILTPREPHASVIKKAVEMFSEGLLITNDEVRLFMHKEYKALGLPNRPTLSTVQEILRNPLYAGYIEYREWNVPFRKAKHSGIISIETYKNVQYRLSHRSKPWKRRDYSLDFPLRSHVLCSLCGVLLTASWNKGRSQLYPNYFCRTKSCPNRWKVISKYKLESEFEVMLSSIAPASQLIDLAKVVLKEQWALRSEKHKDRREKTIVEAIEIDSAIDAYLKRIYKTTDEELISTYEDVIKQLKKQKQSIDIEMGKQKYTKEQFGTASDKVFNALKDPMSLWKSGNHNDKTTVLLMYFERQLVYDLKKGFGTVNLASPLRLAKQAATEDVEMSGSEPESE